MENSKTYHERLFRMEQAGQTIVGNLQLTIRLSILNCDYITKKAVSRTSSDRVLDTAFFLVR